MEKKDSIALSRKLGLVPAVIVKLAGRFGFAREKDGTTEYFVPGRAFKGAMLGDGVLLKPMPSRGDSPEAEVVKVLTEGASAVSGVYSMEKEGNYIYLDSMPKIGLRVVKGGAKGVRDGDKVSAQVVSRGERHAEHRVKVLKVFGSSDAAYACSLAVLADNGITIDFAPETLEEARSVAQTGISDTDLLHRTDLRHLPIFTIDGADTKDIDDAVHVIKHGAGYTLGVHIADVSHYVKEGSALDQEAYTRGTSVYYADRVVPMLPKELSNGICSLNPKEDRLAFSCMMELDGAGKMQSYRFEKTIIRSRVKGVYSEINRLFAGDEDEALCEKYAQVREGLPAMKELALLRMGERKNRGVPEIETTETKIIVGPDGIAEDLVPRTRGFSEELIEEFMLCANEAAASFAQDKKLPFVYRVHEKPLPEKLDALSETLRLLGLNASKIGPGVRPRDMADILVSVKDSPLKRVVNNQVLRSMAKARYTDEPLGHFGLVLENYSHFTSPIRRYPDLAIHRILSGYLLGAAQGELNKRYAVFAKNAGLQSSDCEVRAMTAERSCNDCYKAEYMRSRIGEVFEGVISSAAPHGVYIELANTAEGLIHVDRFPPGNYEYDGRMQFTELHTGRSYRVGDTVSVLVTGADVALGNIDFDFYVEE